MTSKHTPGPWSCIDEGRLDDCVHSAAAEFVEGDIICLSPILEGYEVSAENWEANALLIAAAPELLEALEGFVSCWDACSSPLEFVARARAAIAKATGAA